jgi:hypothetical protein
LLPGGIAAGQRAATPSASIKNIWIPVEIILGIKE